MQTIDPRQGFGRSKALLNKVASKAMARKGYKSRLGVFGRLATSGQQARNLRPARGPGGDRMHRSARPQGYGDVFDGMAVGHRNGEPSGGYVNTAPVQAPIPDIYQGGAPVPGITPLPTAPDGTVGEEGMWNWGNGGDIGGGPPTGIPGGPEAPPPLTQPGGPSGPILAPGGLIPLGNGRYYDPETQLIHGGGRGVSTAYPADGLSGGQVR